MRKINPSNLFAVLNAPSAQASAATPAEDRLPPCSLGICDGTGWQARDNPVDPRLRVLVPCNCRILAQEQRSQRETRERRVMLLGQLDSELGGKLARCTLDNYFLEWAADAAARKTMAEALDSCRLYAAKPIGWLYIHGPVGIGKSHLAAATARAIAAQFGMPTSYTTEPALMAFLRGGWGKSGEESTESRMAALQTADLLVIDDLGKAFRSKKDDQGWIDAQLFELLQPRWMHSRLTILTSNLPLTDLDPAIRSRIEGEAIEITIDNTDQRKREARHG